MHIDIKAIAMAAYKKGWTDSYKKSISFQPESKINARINNKFIPFYQLNKNDRKGLDSRCHRLQILKRNGMRLNERWCKPYGANGNLVIGY